MFLCTFGNITAIKMFMLSVYFKVLIFCLFSFSYSWSQSHYEVNPPDYIKTIIFDEYSQNRQNRQEHQDQFPIIPLGKPITLRFDDLTAKESDYYYKIIHCNYDWTPSKLLKSQYLNGMDDQRIENYRNSTATLQPYSHYTLTLPNLDCKPKISGNYILEIYNEVEELLFSRKFVIYEEKFSVEVQIKKSREVRYINNKQVVHFTINTLNTTIPNPKKDIKVVILQNYNWKTCKKNIPPQYTIGNKLIYRYLQKTTFWGENEYFNFDTKDLRSASNTIYRVELENKFNHLLHTNKIRLSEPYTYFPDINGNFLVNSVRNEDVATESEYTYVHFSLEADDFLKNKRIYVLGKFNNYQKISSNELTYNPISNKYYIRLLLKQGFYNYKYIAIDEENNAQNIGGNFAETENTYLVLVYLKSFGDLYDSIVGVGFGNSIHITN